MKHIIKTTNLTKEYNNFKALNNFNITINKGEIFGLLGPNGAGKTTFIKLLTNLIKPTNGTIEICNEVLTPDSFHLNKKIGSLIEKPLFYENLTGLKNLLIHCEYMGFHDYKTVKQTMNMVGLNPSYDKPVKNYSLGMKQRLAIARAIISKPDILILDEPIQGIDPEGIKDMRNLFKNLSLSKDITIIISSHILSEIQMLADRVAFINKGKLIETLTVEDLISKESKYVEIDCSNATKALMLLDSSLNSNEFKLFNDKIRIYREIEDTKDIISSFLENNIVINSIQHTSSSLEDYYMQIISKKENNHVELN